MERQITQQPDSLVTQQEYHDTRRHFELLAKRIEEADFGDYAYTAIIKGSNS
jgi:hypothetical protein